MKPSIRQTGFTLLELAVVAIIIAILAGIFFNRMLRYQEFAEKTVLEATVADLRSALRLKVAELMIQNRMNEIGNISRENPMSWLTLAPANYVGELKQPMQQPVPPGSWYFDPDHHELVYLLQRSRYFKPGPDGQKLVRYRIILLTRKSQNNANAVIEGVRLTRTTPYEWLVF